MTPSEALNTRRRPRVFAGLLGILAAAMLVGGAELLRLGGSPYYFFDGLVLGGSSVLLWQGRREGALLYVGALALTICWALWESGFDGWALVPRLWMPIVLGLWILRPRFRAALGAGRALMSPAGVGAALLLATAIGSQLHRQRPTTGDPELDVVSSAPAVANSQAASHYEHAAADWSTYGGDPGGLRFSSLTQITPKNVSQLKVAWVYHMGVAPHGPAGYLELNPLKIADTVYLCSGLNDIVALDAETGRPRWRFDAHVDSTGLLQSVTCRGVAYFRAPGPVADCPERIITATVDGRVIAVDARTGVLCESFGRHGQVSLFTGMGEVRRGYYYVSSAPTIVRGKIVLGGAVADGQYWGEPSGVIRAFDAVSGRFAWAFDMGRPQDHGEPGPGQGYTLSTPNSWAPMSADEVLGLVYAPTGNATGTDYYGEPRRPFDDRYSSSVLALNAETGAVQWSFQTTHHDLWDYDLASQPTLVDIPVPGGGLQRALLQPTKRGEIFVLNRITGEPLTKVEERAVPTSGAAPGERISLTQPFSVGMPSFRGPDLSESMMWGITPLDQMLCRIRFKKARYEGTLTPVGLDPTVVYPGYLGGIDWGSVSVDPTRGLMIVNSDRLANYDQLLTRAEADRRGLRPIGGGAPADVGGGLPQANTRYAVDIKAGFLSPLGVPCQQPPYGTLAAVDLATHKVVWSRALGTARDSGPWGVRSLLPITMGVPNQGGSIATASGLVFIAATQERTFRALDVTTGKTLWESPLPAGGHSTPTTYMSAASDRQFVVVAAGGHVALRSGLSDAIVAYAIPK